jgi:formylglycine-generating enzyme required for sulfatase activity
MSPEQKKGEPDSPQSDLYAVGVIAYELLTGENTLGQQRPSELVQGLNSDWDDFVGHATRMDPNQRFADAEAMRLKIPGRSKLSKASSLVKTDSGKQKKWLLFGGIGLAALVVTLAIFYPRSGPDGAAEPVVSSPGGEPPAEQPADPGPEVRPPESGQSFVLEDLGLWMLWLEGGRFQMGSEMGEKDEMPVNRQKVDGFWMGETEVTRRQWSLVMGTREPDQAEGRLPVVDLSLEDANRFVELLNAREAEAGRLPEGYVYALPSEPEWEYACRAGTEGPYAGNLGAMAWYKQKGVNGPQVVASLAPNPWGLYDMHGNVWEWTRTPYAPYPDKRAREDFGNVLRGGGWFSEGSACRSAERGFLIPGFVDLRPGLRLVLRED